MRRYIPYLAPTALLTIVLIAGAFYWFQWRPTQIMKECHKFAVAMAIVDNGNKGSAFKHADYDFRLKFCLQKEGIR